MMQWLLRNVLCELFSFHKLTIEHRRAAGRPFGSGIWLDVHESCERCGTKWCNGREVAVD